MQRGEEHIVVKSTENRTNACVEGPEMRWDFIDGLDMDFYV